MNIHCGILFVILITIIQLQLVTSDQYHHTRVNEHLEQRAKAKRSTDEAENSSYYWIKNAQDKLIDKLSKYGNLNRAKNVIMFLGDGMSIPTLAASRIYMGQLEGKNGEQSELSFEKFPYAGLSKTYCVDKQVADSACSATAYLGGVKANYMTIGVNGKVNLQDCTAAKNPVNQVTSIASWAQDAGKATGIVTTTRVTHASPSGTYAHIANRDMESDADIKNMNLTSSADCQDIASQLIFNEPGSKFNVILGGGRKKFLPTNVFAGTNTTGERLDNSNLIEDWVNSKRKYKAKYVTTKLQLNQIDFTKTDYLLGLFNENHLKYNLDNTDKVEPSLTDMTEAAIKMLQKNRKGFFLFVEGGRIDMAHHDTKAHKALDETVELSKAVQRAVQLTSPQDTLIVVTSDHEHTMSFSGYSKRGNNILGLNTEISSIDKLPYMTLSYANGPGYKREVNGVRHNYSVDNLADKDFLYPALVPLDSETHGGADVGVFALGPWANLFSGVYEQHTIPHMMSFASCIGKGFTYCTKKRRPIIKS